MAICEKKTVALVLPPVEYVLTLNEQEARLLRRLLFSHVAGPGAHPLRAINSALERCGVKAAHVEVSAWPQNRVLQFGEMIAEMNGRG